MRWGCCAMLTLQSGLVCLRQLYDGKRRKKKKGTVTFVSLVHKNDILSVCAGGFEDGRQMEVYFFESPYYI